MKNLFTAILLLLAVSVSAQTVGVLVQPEFSTSNTRKGFFVQHDVVHGLGVYSDYKILNKNEFTESWGTKYEEETRHHQVNVGLTYKVLDNLKALASTSVLNTAQRTISSEDHYYIEKKRKQGSTYQFGGIYSHSYLSVLLAYEIQQRNSNSRITFGLGFNF